jgi:uncharacterized SAM-binding protein YcdF (DUF218 family)
MRGPLRALGLTALLVFLVASLTPAAEYVTAWTTPAPRLEAADAIVVLASFATPEGVLSNPSLRRAIHGIVLQRRELAPLLLLSGAPSEARTRAALARDLGIPPGAILEASGGRTTREEAAFLAPLLKSRGVHRILLVTDPLHLPRAAALFEGEGFAVLPAPTRDVEDYLQRAGSVVQAWTAVLYHRLAGYL